MSRFDYYAVGSMHQYSWFIATHLEVVSTAGGEIMKHFPKARFITEHVFPTRVLGWGTPAIMAIAATGMFATL